MNPTLVKAIGGLIAALLLLAWSAAAMRRKRTIGSILQLLGSVCLMIVVLTHVAEALRLFAFMRWGEPDSAGHYVDLFSAVLGLTLLPLGVLLRSTKR